MSWEFEMLRNIIKTMIGERLFCETVLSFYFKVCYSYHFQLVSLNQMMTQIFCVQANDFFFGSYLFGDH